MVAFPTEQKFKDAFKRIFGDFETIDGPRTAMFNACFEFCEAMAMGTREPYWLSLLGTSGAGKTMLARKIGVFFNRYLDMMIDDSQSDAGHRILRRGGVLEWFRCVDKMVADRDYGFLKQARKDWFLALDDIAAEHKAHRELSSSKLYDILCARERRFTVITANLSVAEIGAGLDTRIGSRLLRHGAVVVDVDVPDFNLPNHGLLAPRSR